MAKTTISGHGNAPDQMTLDLAQLAYDRVDKAIESITQLVEDREALIAIHSAASFSALVQHYYAICKVNKRIVSSDEVLQAIVFGLKEKFKELEEKIADMQPTIDERRRP